MTHHLSIRKHAPVWLVAALLLASLTACPAVDQAADALDNAVSLIQSTQKTIQQESSAWRNELPQLQSDLAAQAAKLEGQGNADAQQLVTDTANQVRSLAQDTIALAGLTAEQLVAKFGAEIRCNVDFVRSRVEATLGELVSRIKFWQQKKTYRPPPQRVCQITPDSAELHSTGQSGGWSMTQPPDKIVGVYGYDFRADALPTVELRNSAGVTKRASAVAVAFVTRYQINLNFGPESFDTLATGDQYVAVWPDRTVNAITLALIVPASLHIVSVEMPATVRAVADSVRPVVTVLNDGGSDSHAFQITWSPGPNDPLKTVPVTNLGAGEKQRYVLPAYTYPNAGSRPTDIQVGSSDSRHSVIDVTPYANVPHQQDEPIRGQWPGSGGEPGYTKSDWGLDAITLGNGCEIDTSRGGGSFTVQDIDKPGIEYLISYPAGYAFNFGDNTIWRSFSALAANYDQQARLATPVVTLKGLGSHGIFGSRGPERFNGTFTVYSMCPQ
ncbi:hypothetical protein Ani05nite_05070 [Amorphoplanes nipponensis]|uniref:Uncharacterized protein n=1 Tax=Actinoplanes nipponensis TaxID=135950 RepID=A0A919JBW0_9ACTN|nr:hypothetical protein [Actinoplanes nipponensis]GIE46973.1 hypothetical protein Ani05nite_05070 [Actinoplanes nipponensis]